MIVRYVRSACSLQEIEILPAWAKAANMQYRKRDNDLHDRFRTVEVDEYLQLSRSGCLLPQLHFCSQPSDIIIYSMLPNTMSYIDFFTVTIRVLAH